MGPAICPACRLSVCPWSQSSTCRLAWGRQGRGICHRSTSTKDRKWSSTRTKCTRKDRPENIRYISYTPHNDPAGTLVHPGWQPKYSLLVVGMIVKKHEPPNVSAQTLKPFFSKCAHRQIRTDLWRFHIWAAPDPFLFFSFVAFYSFFLGGWHHRHGRGEWQAKLMIWMDTVLPMWCMGAHIRPHSAVQWTYQSMRQLAIL